MKCAIGVDFGGTKIHAARVTKTGKILKEIIIPTERNKGQKHIIQNLDKAIQTVMNSQVEGIGVGAPDANYYSGKILKAVNIAIKNYRLRYHLKRKFKLNTVVDNDANVFTLGESMFGCGKKLSNIIGITLGTGVGGGIIINKKLYRGRGSAGELGHITMNFDVEKKYKNYDSGSIEYFLHQIPKKHPGKTVKEISELAKKGNKKAQTTWNQFGKSLGIELSNISNIFDPEMIIIGGSVSKSWNLFKKTTLETLKKGLLHSSPKIKHSKLKNAAVLGAAALIWE